MSLLVSLSLLALCAILVVQVMKRKDRGLPYPPGPPADPIIGHLRFIPTTDAQEAFHEWSRKYGDVMYLEVLGKPLVVLSTEEAAIDLLVKRSANYSDRPSFPLFER